MASTEAVKKPINGHAQEEPTHALDEHRLSEDSPDIMGDEFIMSRSRPTLHDEELLRVLLALSTGQEKVNATQDKICDNLDIISSKLNNGNTTKTPNWVIPIITTILFALVALTFKSVTDNVQRIENKQDKIETYEQRVREEFAAHGWRIDPDTGKMTKVGP
jgi:hypothetical protein